MTHDESVQLAQWRYDPPFDFYDGAGDEDAGYYTLQGPHGRCYAELTLVLNARSDR